MLGDDWKNVFDTYVQTIGNITLTRYNSEMSNDPFINKRDMKGGFKETGLRLNTYINKCDQWTKEEIIQRADELYKKSLNVFPRPNLNQEKLDEYKNKKNNQEYSLEDYDNYHNNDYIKNLFDRLWKLLKNINQNLELNFKKSYINITDNEDIIGSLVINKNNIKFFFKNWEEIIDENKITKWAGNNNGVPGNTLFYINEEKFEECSIVIEQVIEKYSD
jgi:predicted transport protein